jgi:hypothetical protein
MYPITDDPLEWQGPRIRFPFWIPDGGLLFAWPAYEIWVANDEVAAFDDAHAARDQAVSLSHPHFED